MLEMQDSVVDSVFDYNDYITMFESDPFSEETITTGEQLMISISQE